MLQRKKRNYDLREDKKQNNMIIQIKNEKGKQKSDTRQYNIRQDKKNLNQIKTKQINYKLNERKYF